MEVYADQQIIEQFKRLISNPASDGERQLVSDWLDDSYQMEVVNND